MEGHGEEYSRHGNGDLEVGRSLGLTGTGRKWRWPAGGELHRVWLREGRLVGCSLARRSPHTPDFILRHVESP